MASLVLSGDTSGSITVAAPAVAGSNTQTLVATTGTLAPIVSGTAVASTSGTSIDFTSIPSWVKRITVVFQGVSLSATANPLIQLGTGATPTYTTSGYLGAAVNYLGSGATNPTTGFAIASALAANLLSGHLVLTNISGNIWVASGIFGTSNTPFAAYTAGNVSLGSTLTAIRITSTSTDTFDAGSINILYE